MAVIGQLVVGCICLISHTLQRRDISNLHTDLAVERIVAKCLTGSLPRGYRDRRGRYNYLLPMLYP